jgi:hypothetical protein
MKQYPFFKCRFCKTLGVCAVRMLDHTQSYGCDSLVQCRYGTGLSLWKWFVRILCIVGVSLLIWDCIHFLQLSRVHQICMIGVCGVLCAPWLIKLVFQVIELHVDFRHKGGKYFFWED